MLPPTNRLLDNWDPVGNGYLRAPMCGFNPALYVHVRRLYYVLLCHEYIHIETKKKEMGTSTEYNDALVIVFKKGNNSFGISRFAGFGFLMGLGECTL